VTWSMYCSGPIKLSLARTFIPYARSKNDVIKNYNTRHSLFTTSLHANSALLILESLLQQLERQQVICAARQSVLFYANSHQMRAAQKESLLKIRHGGDDGEAFLMAHSVAEKEFRSGLDKSISPCSLIVSTKETTPLFSTPINSEHIEMRVKNRRA
jgi:hypothetical protein